MDYASFFNDLFDLFKSLFWFFLGIFLAVQVAVVGLCPARLGFWGASSAAGILTFFGVGVMMGFHGAVVDDAVSAVAAIGGLGAIAVAGIWRVALQEYLSAWHNAPGTTIFLRRARRNDPSDAGDSEDAS